MANILICTVGVYSHINTLSGVAKRLVAAGHKVRLLLQRIQHVNALGRQGYKIYCTTPSTDVNIPDEQLEVECSIEADKCLERIKPDLVLADAEWHEVIVRSLKLNLNIVGLDFHCSPDRWSNVPPLNSHYIPSSRIVSRIRCQLEWQKSLGRRRKRGVVDNQIKSLAMIVGESEQTIRSIIAVDHWQPMRFNNIDYWSLTAEQFDFPHSEPGASRYMGPCIDYARSEDKGDAEFERWFEKTTKNERSGRFVFASLGSLVQDESWIEGIIEAAKIKTDWSWLVTTPTKHISEKISDLPENIHITGSAPQLRVLNYCDVMLAGAGIASIHECISTSTPMVAYSLGVLDQNGNAARVHYHGIGQMSRAGQDSAEVIVDRVNDLSSNKICISKMAVLKTCLEEYDDQQILENEVEKTLNGTTIHG